MIPLEGGFELSILWSLIALLTAISVSREDCEGGETRDVIVAAILDGNVRILSNRRGIPVSWVR